MSAANRGARYGLETPSAYGRIVPQRAVPTAKFLRAIRGCRRRFPARRTQGGAWGWRLCHPKARRRHCGTPEANRSEGTCGGAVKRGIMYISMIPMELHMTAHKQRADKVDRHSQRMREEGFRPVQFRAPETAEKNAR